jgi:hypothetical protein
LLLQSCVPLARRLDDGRDCYFVGHASELFVFEVCDLIK